MNAENYLKQGNDEQRELVANIAYTVGADDDIGGYELSMTCSECPAGRFVLELTGVEPFGTIVRQVEFHREEQHPTAEFGGATALKATMASQVA